MIKILSIFFIVLLYLFNCINSATASIYPDSFTVSEVTFNENTKTLSFNYSSSPSYTISQFTKVQLIAEDGYWFMGNNNCTLNHCNISNLYDYDRSIFFSRNLYSSATKLQVSIYPNSVTQIYSQHFVFGILFPTIPNKPKSITVSDVTYNPNSKTFSFMFKPYPEETSFNDINLYKLYLAVEDGSAFEGNWSCLEKFCTIQDLSGPLRNISLTSALYSYSTRLQVIFQSENNDFFTSQDLTMMDIFPPATYFPTGITITNLLFDPQANRVSFDYVTTPPLLTDTFHKIQINMEDGHMFHGTWLCQHNHCHLFGLFDTDRSLYFSDALYPPYTQFQISIYPTEQWQIYSQTFTMGDIYPKIPPLTSIETNIPISTDRPSTKPVVVNLTATASAGYTVSHTYYTINNSPQQEYTAPFALSPVGEYDITYWSVDDAGLFENQKATTIRIIYPFSGFYWPIKNLPAINTVKSTFKFIPLPFNIGGYRGKDIFKITPTSSQIPCPSKIPQNMITDPTLITSIGGLVYNPLTKQYIYFLKTNKTWKGTCRKVALILNDNTEHTAAFYFK